MAKKIAVGMMAGAKKGIMSEKEIRAMMKKKMMMDAAEMERLVRKKTSKRGR